MSPSTSASISGLRARTAVGVKNGVSRARCSRQSGGSTSSTSSGGVCELGIASPPCQVPSSCHFADE
jgi:hypothetical protein